MGARPIGRLSALQRIRKRADFRRVQSRGQRVVTPHFVFLLESSGGAASPRLGITASRKVGNAVVRNRAKRLVREAFRSTRELFPPGADIVVIVRRALNALRLDDVVAEWRAAQGPIQSRLGRARREHNA